jgi:hypothetical protein
MSDQWGCTELVVTPVSAKCALRMVNSGTPAQASPPTNNNAFTTSNPPKPLPLNRLIAPVEPAATRFGRQAAQRHTTAPHHAEGRRSLTNVLLRPGGFAQPSSEGWP